MRSKSHQTHPPRLAILPGISPGSKGTLLVNAESKTRSRNPALNFAVLLALAVFCWGLHYKLSLYHPVNHQGSTQAAKLLSQRERPDSNLTTATCRVSVRPTRSTLRLASLTLLVRSPLLLPLRLFSPPKISSTSRPIKRGSSGASPHAALDLLLSRPDKNASLP